MNQGWTALAAGVQQCRLAFLDVTVGLIMGRSGVVLVDSGTTLAEARTIEADVHSLCGRAVTHLVLTHDHFDHVLGSSVFAASGAAVYCAPEVGTAIATGTEALRAEALSYGAAAAEIDRALGALRAPGHLVRHAEIDLGDRLVTVDHPGRGHTCHDLIVVATPRTATDPTVVFCGDLVEESGDPSVGPDSDIASWADTLDRVLDIGGPDAVYVPGHGAPVDAAFVRRQQRHLRSL